MSDSDTVRRFYAAVSRRDLPGLLQEIAPSIDFDPVLGILYREHRYHGLDGITRWYEEVCRSWDSFEVRVEDTVDAGDHLVAFLRLVAQGGKESLDAQIAIDCRFTGGRISSIVGREAWDAAEELGVEPPEPG